MRTREWTVDTPTPHRIRLEREFFSGETRISVDGMVIHFYRPTSLLADFGFTHTFEIDGVSYTLKVRADDRSELHRTGAIADDPPPTRSQAIFWSLPLFVLSGFLFEYAYHVDEPEMAIVLAYFTVVSLAAAVYVAVVWPKQSKWHPVTTSSNASENRTDEHAGSPPRTRSFFRPLLEDIRSATARWKSRAPYTWFQRLKRLKSKR